MTYGTWERFSNPLQRAIQSASNTGMVVDQEFRRSAKPPASGGKAREDYELSRQAAYLVAMNGDPNKPEVAAAQAYFATRTVQAEVVEQRASVLPAWAQALHALVDQQAAIEVEQQRQAAAVREIEARVVSVEGAHNEFTALGYAKLNDLPTDRRWLAQLGKCASAALRQAGEEPHKRQDATFGLINVYPTWALDAGLAEMPDAA
jgi:DNA-damage-inducible protein D